MFSEAGDQMVPFLDELLDLVGEGDVGQGQPAILVVVSVVLVGVAGLCTNYIWNSLSSSKGSIIR